MDEAGTTERQVAEGTRAGGALVGGELGIPGSVLAEALWRRSGAFVMVLDRSGRVVRSNASSARWFGALAASGEGEAIDGSGAVPARSDALAVGSDREGGGVSVVAASGRARPIPRGGDRGRERAVGAGASLTGHRRGAADGEVAGDAGAVFLSDHAALRAAVERREPSTLSGTWRGVCVEACLFPIDASEGSVGGSMVVVRPCVFDGSETVGPREHLGGASPLDALTSNELEVLKLIGLGLRTKEIAKQIHRSEKTIEARRSSIGRKLGLSTRGDLVRVAIRSGLATL